MLILGSDIVAFTYGVTLCPLLLLSYEQCAADKTVFFFTGIVRGLFQGCGESEPPPGASVATSMEKDTNVKCRVAVVGSGMAGLVTAYLLNRDPEQRYNVEVFELVKPQSEFFPT